MSLLETFMNFLNSLPSQVWESAIAALFLSPFMLGVKHWLDEHRELVMLCYVIGGAFFTAGLAYLKDAPDTAPWLMIPLQGLVTFALSQPVYYAIVKPLRNKSAAWIDEANKLNEAKRAAKLPENAPLPADFSA